MNRRRLRPFCFCLRGISALSSLFLPYPQHRAFASIHAPSFDVNDVYFRQAGRADGKKKGKIRGESAALKLKIFQLLTGSLS